MENLKKQDLDWINVARKLKDVREHRLYFEKLEKAFADKLQELSGGENSIGDVFKYTYSYKKGGIDYLLIPEMQNVDIEKYRKPDIKVWKLEEIQPELLDL